MIGVFDSGVGGLCALAVLKERMPHADLLYFADTENLPYGEKEPAVLLELTRRAVSLLLSEGAEAILAACGTVSTVVLPRLTDCPLPIYGVLRPTAEATGRSHSARGKDILLLGTHATLKSGAFSREIQRCTQGATLHTLACPLFVPLAESGRIAPHDALARMYVSRILAPLRGYDIGTVVLGCTHFSHLLQHISREFPHAQVIDAAREASLSLAASREKCESGGGRIRLLTSKDPARLTEAARHMFPSLGLEAEEVHIPLK